MMRAALAALLLAGVAPPAIAQSSADLPGRVDRIEKELRAVQRKVFPGGDGAYFEPQIAAPVAPPPSEGTPATSAVGDLTARVAALETQVRQLTNQSEVNNHRLDVIEQNYAKLQADTDFRLRQVETGTPSGAPGTPPASAAGSPAPSGTAARKPSPARPASGAGETLGDAQVDLTRPAPSTVPETGAPLAVAKTGDPAEDGYMAGYQLWSQKRYAEAEAQLKEVVAKYPASKRASYSQNLLGRAYMDDGQLSTAADAFLTSYKKFPRGERAPDSLYYLGVTLTKLKKGTQACQVFDELRDVYGATINPTLKGRITTARADAKCGA
ncbi:tetratricopeptide repeat protein [Sphingomonas sp.]|uniref:tetratricopeptide repeat protein n=1 Tax=Sphingomonas sp. TaxID=28214 RepID=UPI003B00464F